MCCSAPDASHEIAQMFHLHVGLIWLKDNAWPDLLRGAAPAVARVAI
jgi:hypothetical protein